MIGSTNCGIDRVHDQVNAVVPGHVRDAFRGRGIDLMRLVLATVVDRVDDVLGTIQVVVRDEHVLEPVAIGGNLGDSLADRAGADQ